MGNRGRPRRAGRLSSAFGRAACSTNRRENAALTGLTHGELCDRPDLRRTATALVNEGKAVADALGIRLDSDPDELISKAARENHQHKPSMLQDALARRPTEIDALNGGIVRAGEQAGVPTPLHATIAALIAGLEAGWKD